jgi:hypothetical protein
MKKLLMIAVSAFALTVGSQAYAGADIDIGSNNDGNVNDNNALSVVGSDNDDNDILSGNDGNANNKNKSGNAVQGSNNDENTIIDTNVDDITVHVKVDASKRIAKSESTLSGVICHNKVNNGGANVNLALGAKQAAGNSIRTGGVSQTGGFGAGISAQQAATGMNTLNQAQVQVSAQASFNGL